MDSSGHNPNRRDRIPVPIWNRIVRATEHTEKTAHGVDSEVSFSEQAPNIVLAKNVSGSDVDRHGVLSFSGVETDPSISTEALKSFRARPILSASAPSDGVISWGIAVDAIKQGEIGRIAVAGCIPARIQVSDPSHQYARPTSSTSSLASCRAVNGAVTILWKDAGTGLKWALVRFGDGDPVRLGKTSAPWDKGTVASIPLWESGTPPSETQTTGQQLNNCVNKFANVASGKWVMLARGQNGNWYLISAECG